MNTKTNVIRRGAALVAALALFVGAVAPVLQNTVVRAAQLEPRSIKMSNSTPGATAQYELSFYATNAATALIVDFCSDTPLQGATCAFAATSVPTISSPVASAGTAATVGSGSPIHTIKVTGLTIAAGATYTLTFSSGITNPTNATPGAQSFYARIYTYATSGDAGNYVPANTSGSATTQGANVLDFGGVALSTTNHVTITARVMETLTFCVSGSNIDGTAGVTHDECSEATAPSLDIGTGSPKVLDASRIDSGTAYTQLSTNASNGAVVRMKATNTCTNAGLSSNGGTTCNIPGISSGTYTNGTAPIAMTAGTAAYGLFVSASRTTTGIASSTGTITPDVNYNDGTHTNEASPDTVYYGMDRQSGSGAQGVLTVYGDPIASAAGPCSRINNNLLFAITPSLTTPAGIYTGDEILIATGNF